MKRFERQMVPVLVFCFCCCLFAVLLSSGCRPSDGGDSISPFSPTSEIGTAGSAKLQLLLATGSTAIPLASLNSTVSGARAILTVSLLNGLATESRIATYSQVIALDGSNGGLASIAALTALPALVRVTLENRTIDGFATFHGAVDLLPGENVLVLNPVGSNLPSDILARVCEMVVGDPGLFACAGTDLVTLIQVANPAWANGTGDTVKAVSDSVCQRLLGTASTTPFVFTPRICGKALDTLSVQTEVAIDEALAPIKDGIRFSRKAPVSPMRALHAAILEARSLLPSLRLEPFSRRFGMRTPAVMENGSAAIDGPFANEWFIASFSTTALSLTKVIATSFDGMGYAASTRPSTRITITGIRVSEEQGIIRRISGSGETLLTIESLDGTGKTSQTIAIRITSGGSFEAAFSSVPSNGAFIPTGSLWNGIEIGITEERIGTDSFLFQVPSGLLAVAFDIQDAAGQHFSMGCSIAGINGTYEVQRGVRSGRLSSRKDGIVTVLPYPGRSHSKLAPTVENRGFGFPSETVTVTAFARMPSADVDIDRLWVTLPKFTLLSAVAGTYGHFTDLFTTIAAYGGYSLTMRGSQLNTRRIEGTFRNLTFERGKRGALDGLELELKKVNLDGSANRFRGIQTSKEIRWQCLDPENTFVGGTETLQAVDDTATPGQKLGVYSGLLKFKGTDGTMMDVAYRTMETSRGSYIASTTFQTALATHTAVIVFTTGSSKTLSGTLYRGKKTVDDKLDVLGTIERIPGVWSMTNSLVYAPGSGLTGSSTIHLSNF